MKEIQLTKGKVALVDDEDFNYLNQFKWQVSECRHTSYAIRTERKNGLKKTIRMHRDILSITDVEIIVDHIDHNGLNNQKNNLRQSSCSENNSNRSVVSHSSSNYLGVTKKVDKRFKKTKFFWYAQIRKDKKTHFIGSFPYTSEGEIAAAKAYDDRAILIHGEFANLNFK